MSLPYILILSTILYASWQFGQAWITKREFYKRKKAICSCNYNKAGKK